MSADWETQKAIYAALSALGLTVYDVPPQTADGGSLANWPFVTLGVGIFTPWDDKVNTGFNFVQRIHTRSRTSSKSEAKGMNGQIYDRLHRGTLTITGYDLTLLEFQSSEVDQVSDKSFHGVSEYRGLIQKA
jgi:hypothetical protein